jgi:hypothetical protein
MNERLNGPRSHNEWIVLRGGAGGREGTEYGAMKRHWTTDELIDEWTRHLDDLGLLGTKTGPGRLGFAVLLMYFRHEGRFPRHQHEVPGAVVAHLAKQVAVSPEDFLR